MICAGNNRLVMHTFFTEICQKFQSIGSVSLKRSKSSWNLDVFLRWKILFYMLKMIIVSYKQECIESLIELSFSLFFHKMFCSATKFEYLREVHNVILCIKYSYCRMFPKIFYKFSAVKGNINKNHFHIRNNGPNRLIQW